MPLQVYFAVNKQEVELQFMNCDITPVLNLPGIPFWSCSMDQFRFARPLAAYVLSDVLSDALVLHAKLVTTNHECCCPDTADVNS